jgi:hypothetical protein
VPQAEAAEAIERSATDNASARRGEFNLATENGIAATMESRQPSIAAHDD